MPGRFIFVDLGCLRVGEVDLFVEGESARLFEGDSARRSADACEDVLVRGRLGGGSLSEVTATLVDLSR